MNAVHQCWCERLTSAETPTATSATATIIPNTFMLCSFGEAPFATASLVISASLSLLDGSQAAPCRRRRTSPVVGESLFDIGTHARVMVSATARLSPLLLPKRRFRAASDSTPPARDPRLTTRALSIKRAADVGTCHPIRLTERLPGDDTCRCRSAPR